jgi:hypothetical protein
MQATANTAAASLLRIGATRGLGHDARFAHDRRVQAVG